MTAISILEHKLNSLLKDRKKFYKRKKNATESNKWLLDVLMKYHNDDIRNIRKAIKILKCNG
jgi:hypothetical protein